MPYPIGLVLVDVANPFNVDLHRAIAERARQNDVDVLSGSSDEDPIQEHRVIDRLLETGVAGLIVVPSAGTQAYLSQKPKLPPVVFLDRPPRDVDADWIASDNFTGALLATRHLLARGHRRVAVIADSSEITTARERVAGFRHAMEEAGLPPIDEHVVMGCGNETEAAEATRALLDSDSPPTAIFTAQNLITLGAVGELHRQGRHRDVALVGFDRLDLAETVSPGLTLVEQDAAALGMAAFELLVRRIEGDSRPPQRVRIPPELVMRGSGEIPGLSVVRDRSVT